ncbi:cytochrome c [Sulfurimicrobium lacus]|uniref:Cytochrome c n=1 Tax=Sulfurimicrobium lacus TaxID=2715678 RepID=A0A6F8VBY1_9PROT|nr:RhuM family protein [Sulfurimicrobium lacus]BCB26249.1 cytochrome c [Sulfurimicrobium lacus]
MSDIVIYEAENGAVSVRLDSETVWLSLQQMTELFARDKSVISRHLRNIFMEGELDREAVVAKNATTAADGKTYQVEHFNLDAILSVGYRVNSKQGTRFRQWATHLLKEHLTRGYTLSRERFEANARELEAALELVRKAARTPELAADSGRGLVEIVSRYTQTFLWLQRYDEGLLTEPAGSPGGLLPSLEQARSALTQLKNQLLARHEATDLFARERGDSLAALLGNLDQTVFGEPAYPTIEAKAAHLLYFMVKNHPFTDGNKRSGAFMFVDFLHRNGRLLNARGDPLINDTGLAALTLLVAESDPAQKEVLIRLIMNMLAPETSA